MSAIAGSIGAIAASIGVIIALIYYNKNLKLNRLSNSARMVLDFVNIFNSAEMRKHRRRFASLLLEDSSLIDLKTDAPVLEFFEEVAYMTRRGVLDEGMVWNSFSWWVKRYYLAVKDRIVDARSEVRSSSLFREVEWLYTRMCLVGNQQEGTSIYIPPSANDIRKFFEDESKLDSAQP
ncbi:MAG: DUF4760 domain-containing protein [Acidobacteriota bacterium]|nr:DUF4760 domain-containing protein [Acidobacteriota bacterium]